METFPHDKMRYLIIIEIQRIVTKRHSAHVTNKWKKKMTIFKAERIKKHTHNYYNK